MIIQIPDFCKECTEYPHCEAKFGTDAYACTDYNIATMHEIETHANMIKTVDLDDPIQIGKAKSQLYSVEDPFEEE